MANLRLFGAAALFSALFATQAFAQAAVQEPGAAAFYHPNADLLHASQPAPRDALAFYPGRPELGGPRPAVRPHRAHHRSLGKPY